MSCEKSEDPNMKKVYYNTQPTYSSGGNPNPNGVSSSGGSATTTGTSSSGTATSGTSTTGSSCTDAMTVNAVPCTSTSAIGGSAGSYRIIHSGSCIQVQIQFSTTSAPTSGTYQIVTGTPVAGQCTFLDNTNTIFATGGSVTITTGSPNKVSYSNISVGVLTATGTGCYP